MPTTLPYRFSPASREARAIGYRLLDASSIYEGIKSSELQTVATVALVIRSRRLLVAAYQLADYGEGQEANHLLRAMTEAALTVAWLRLDPELNFLRWLFVGSGRLLSHDLALRKLERERRTAEGFPPASSSDEPLGLLRPEMRRRMEEALTARRAELKAFDRLEERLEPAGQKNRNKAAAERAERIPHLREMARLSGLISIYEIGYRWESNTAAHASSLAVEQLLQPGSEEGAVIASSPVGQLPDPYAVGATLLAMTLSEAGEIVPALRVDLVEQAAAELAELKPFKVIDDS
jgi:Family of unknown function (DUF5677)